MVKLIDTHAHLYKGKLRRDIDNVLRRAKEVCEAVYLPNIDLTSIPEMQEVVNQDPEFCFPMLGLHPCHVEEDLEEVLTQMEQEWENGNYVAVGETGLDLFRPQQKASIELQKESLKIQIQWAKARQLPIILHARDAIDETYELIAQHHDETLTGIFHCFDGTAEQAHKIAELGTFKIGIGGIVTYGNSSLPKVLEEVDIQHLVLETDSPYLAPEPHRRTANESSYVRFVANKLVEVYDISWAEVARITTESAKAIFNPREHKEGIEITEH